MYHISIRDYYTLQIPKPEEPFQVDREVAWEKIRTRFSHFSSLTAPAKLLLNSTLKKRQFLIFLLFVSIFEDHKPGYLSAYKNDPENNANLISLYV